MSKVAQDYLRRAITAPLYDLVRRTSLDPAPDLSDRIGHRLWLKREDMQTTYSFKLRGAYNCIRQLSEEERNRGVVAASAGNHAQGVAMSARELGVKATIFMPLTTPGIKVRAVKALGARIELCGDDYDTACEMAIAFSEQSGGYFIHPFDNPEVIAGQGTIGIEISQQLEAPPGVIFIPIGGGGLAAGVAATIKAVYPQVRVIGVEPEDAASMQAALAAGQPVDIGTTGIFSDGVAVRKVGSLTFDLCRELVDEVITVSVDAVCAAVKSIFEEVRATVEPAGALAVAGAIQYAAREAKNSLPEGDWVALLSGANVNFDRLGHIVERCALGEGTEALLVVTIPERAGSFLEFCRTLGESSVTEFNYRFASRKHAHIFVGVRLQESSSHLQEKLIKGGYGVQDLSDNEVAKLHMRHLVGGRLPSSECERLYRFEFPERPGALLEFLAVLAGRWSISLFHYRNHAAANARILAGFLVPAEDEDAFHQFLEETGYPFIDETENVACLEFLSAPPDMKAALKTAAI
ncbi:MAG: threonine ammonia-lyase, biosynthetic [Xanthomonadales bacterium]|nr:threonine ammonia-lyase, biosynthetic [Xanthomonadales bacterium]